MLKNVMTWGTTLTLVCWIVGCSASGGASTGFSIGKNLSKKDSHLNIMLDGESAKQNKLKKAASGYSRFEIKEPVSTTPTLQFEIEDPDKFGRITWVSLQIHQKFEADYSHHAEFNVFSEDTNNPEAQMRPDTKYDLGNPPPGLKVMNYKNEEVDGVELKPGMEYMLVLTVKADKSETAQIYFETK